MRYVALPIVGALALCALLLYELETSQLQSRVISRYAGSIDHWLEDGPNRALRYPERGPFDERAGYADLPAMLTRLERSGFAISAQARVSARFEETLARGLFPIYAEKTQTGLEILDRDRRTMFAYAYPERVFPSFDAIPPLLVRSLLYVENRELLDPERPYRNPAVEWDRLAVMALKLGRRSLGEDSTVQGASTLATQIEKFRHSPGGLTQAPGEKFRQMASATVRAYRGGPSTLDAQRTIILDYLNGLPLAALPNHGEVHGLVDGLRLWYGIEAGELELLREPLAAEHLPRAAFVYRAALSLILATRRPAFYLRDDTGELERLCDSYARLLEREQVIPEALSRAVLGLRVERRLPDAPRRAAQLEQKAANAIRADLLGLLGIGSLYRLDRLDLTVSTSFADEAQAAVGRELRELERADHRAAAGLTGPRLLPERDDLPITYSILLCEATSEGNFVRLRTDSFPGPRDVNRNTKLELGSTAKLRTLVSYLEIVEALHEQLAGAPPDAIAAYLRQFGDPLTAWLGGLVQRTPELTLHDALAAALARRYSASPAERFFTAGGVHTFSNFERASDSTAPTVEEALSQSVNLVFIRIMRDIVRYHEARIPFASDVATDSRHPLRVAYLSRFADREGQQYLRRFHARHYGLTPAASIERLLGGKAAQPLRAARVYLAVQKDASSVDLAAFLAGRGPAASSGGQDDAEALYRRVRAERWSLADLAYLVDVHPLELWVAQYLAANPESPLSQTVAAADEAVQEAYGWLFRTRRKELQDRRIRTVLETEAFAKIHASWRNLGYPFPFLVPSYATAIGSSGDGPEALAELVGILVNDGLRRPIVDVAELRFAEGTPFETHLRREPAEGVRVLSPAVARAAKAALADVVANGTGRRVRDVFVAADGTPLPIGGKTGTGDNRHVIVDWRGERTASYARNRTASLVFFVGNHFGVVTAHVDGPAAEGFAFTSALPAQLLRHLAPLLDPVVQRPHTSLLSSAGTVSAVQPL